MANLSIANDSAIAAANAVVDLVDASSPTAGKVRIYDGTIPADADTAIAAQTLLAEITLDDPAFGAATDQAPGARASALGLPLEDSSADATGTASWFRLLDGSNNVILQGDVSTVSAGTGDMQMNSTAIQSGAAVSITAFNVDMPES